MCIYRTESQRFFVLWNTNGFQFIEMAFFMYMLRFIHLFYVWGNGKEKATKMPWFLFSIGRLEIDQSLVGLGERVFCFILASFFQVP